MTDFQLCFGLAKCNCVPDLSRFPAKDTYELALVDRAIICQEK